MGHWTLDDIGWERFDAGKVDPDVLRLVKAAALVEYNAVDYATYLGNVFTGDPAFIAAAQAWAQEEVQHGLALARWATLADPRFDFEARFARFREGYKIDTSASNSKRGSRSAELVSRCMVETGTSTYYTALGDATEEPVLREICRKIAADELRHYKLFYDHLKDYVNRDRLGRLQRLRVALSRIAETEDDELSFAFFCGSSDPQAKYDRDAEATVYLGLSYRYWRDTHFDRAVKMIFKACGLKDTSWLFRLVKWMAFREFSKRAQKLARAARSLPAAA